MLYNITYTPHVSQPEIYKMAGCTNHKSKYFTSWFVEQVIVAEFMPDARLPWMDSHNLLN